MNELVQNSAELLDFSHCLILIIDDNPTNLAVVVDYLVDYGFQIIVARNGEKGIKRAALAQPDIILLDVMMPGMDGFEACRRLKANPRTQDIPVIFMTALSDIESKLKGFEVGSVDYVTKPLQREEIMARVLTHLRLRVLTKHLEQKVQERTQLLNQAYHKLERLDKAKTDFINVMSHELRTPLNLVYGYAQILQETPSVVVDEEASNITDGILRGAKRMIEVINHVFDATEVDSNLLRLKKHELSLAAAIKDVCAFFETVWVERNLDLVIENLSDLPIIQVDNNLIYKAFYHLIVNAIKYTPDGGKITISGQYLEGEPPMLEIRIKDTGIGIEPEQLELIFEKFYQTGRVDLHSTGKSSYKGGGPGLGLAIVKGIILAHGGRVWAESSGYDEEKFLGSVFYVQLPVE